MAPRPNSSVEACDSSFVEVIDGKLESSKVEVDSLFSIIGLWSSMTMFDDASIKDAIGIVLRAWGVVKFGKTSS